MTTKTLATPLELPCGAVLCNRIAKAAMSEQLSSRGRVPGRGLYTLYERWAQGGAGMLLTGNVMVDDRYLESHRNVVLEAGADLERFRRWAATMSGTSTQLWMQVNHPGRQCPRHIHPHPPAPSAVKGVKLLRAVKAFGEPVALDEAGIQEIIERFGVTAELAAEAGFGGVQIHGAHGYLVSQFLSPLTNVREDDWGGSLQRRARFLLEIVRRMRRGVGASFPLSVKLNSADFQKGGFDEDDSLTVLRWLVDEGIDLVEISGGNYESPAMFNLDRPGTSHREAFFLDFAKRARAEVDIPLMVTGGFRSRQVMHDALDSGALDVIGMARPFANDPDIARKLVDGTLECAPQPTRWLGTFGMRALSEAMLSVTQMAMMSKGLEPGSKLAALVAVGRSVLGSSK